MKRVFVCLVIVAATLVSAPVSASACTAQICSNPIPPCC